MIATNRNDRLPSGTRVLNTNDGQPGTIMNGSLFESAAGWIEYEVETEFGIEVWLRTDFILFSEMEDAIDG